MKAMCLTGLRRLECLEVPEPVLSKPDDVLLQMEAVGICGSDVHYFSTGRIGSQVVSFPFTLGHEGAGTVLAAGPAVRRVRPGERVAIEPAMTCGGCDQCLAGRSNTCRNIHFLGCPGQAEGCLSERLIMPEICCFPVGAHVSVTQAALSEPLAIGIYALRKAGCLVGASVGILGAGVIGHSVLRPGRATGIARAYVTDPLAFRRQYALAAGADHAFDPEQGDVVAAILEREPLGLDVVFECCGRQTALDQAVQLLKPGGKLMLIGIPEVDRISFQIDLMRRKEILLHNVRRQEGCASLALDLIAQGRVEVDSLVTHEYDFPDTPLAFETVVGYRDGVLKAMIHLGR